MSEVSFEPLKSALESDLPEQIELRVRRERRRRWTPAEKLAILREAFAPGAVAKRVAERYEISTGLLFTWRKQIMRRPEASFLPVQVITNSDTRPRPDAAAPTVGTIEVDLPNGVRLRFGHGVDLKILRGLLSALGRS